MRRRLCAAILVILVHIVLGSAFGANANADDGSRSRVALVRSSSNDPVLHEATTRVRAELLAAGFLVVDVDQVPGDARSGVEDAAPETSSFATIAMSRAANGASADVWISDHLTGKTVVRRLQVGSGANATAVLAIRTLELLRASLLEVAARVPPAEPPMAAPVDVMKWIEPALPASPAAPASPAPLSPLRGTSLALGALSLHGLRGIGLAIGPTLGVSQGFGPWFGRLVLAGPLLGPNLQTTTGSATVRQELGALELGWASVPRPVGVQAWIGAGGYDLHTDGSAAAPFRAKRGDVISFLMTAGVGVLFEIGPRVGLTADVMAMVMDPEPVVVIVNRDAGAAGLPSIGGSIGLIVGL
jgi:hypothetical protein